MENILSADIMSKVKDVWIKFAQGEIKLELQQSVKTDKQVKIHGRFTCLSPFIDSDGIWRVGLRLRLRENTSFKYFIS